MPANPGMPWVSIIMALLAFFVSGGKKKEDRAKALVAAGAVGLGTYYATHETDWLPRSITELDGVVQPITTPLILAEGTGEPVTVAGSQVRPTVTVLPSGATSSSGVWDTLKSWGAAGTATVVGVGTGAISGNNILLFGGLALAVILLLK